MTQETGEQPVGIFGEKSDEKPSQNSKEKFEEQSDLQPFEQGKEKPVKKAEGETEEQLERKPDEKLEESRRKTGRNTRKKQS